MTHFSNTLYYGKVTIDTEIRSVNFTTQELMLSHFLYPDFLLWQIEVHQTIARDILYKAFQRLIHENEASAIIIADILREKENKKEE